MILHSTRSPCSWPELLWPSPKGRIQRGQNDKIIPNPQSAILILCVWIKNQSEGYWNVLEIKWIRFWVVIWKWLGDSNCRRVKLVCWIEDHCCRMWNKTSPGLLCRKPEIAWWLSNRHRWFCPIHKENLEMGEIGWNASKPVRLTTAHPAPRIGLTWYTAIVEWMWFHWRAGGPVQRHVRTSHVWLYEYEVTWTNVNQSSKSSMAQLW